MKKYVLVYGGGRPPTTAEERDTLMRAWRTWVCGLGAAVVDPGNPFGPALAVDAAGTIGAIDAFAIGGYMIFTAAGLGIAAELARGCPHRTILGGTIAVYETLPID